MAQIDLKNVTIEIHDGYHGPGGTPTINNYLADPVSAPTATATGGGATGGSLAAGDYLLSYTYVTVDGETLRSPDSSTLTVGSTNIPRVTFPALPVGAVSRTLYVSTPSGNRASEKLYASGITTLTYDMAIAAPGITAPPSVSTAGLMYSIGTTTIAVTGFNGAVVNGDLFTLAGDPATGPLRRYTVSSHSESSGDTINITFTPSLDKLVDNLTALVMLPHILQIKIGEGNLTYDEKRKIKYVTDRGLLDAVRLDDQEPVEVKMDFTWEYLRAANGSDPPTAEEAFKKTGNASSWVTSGADPCEPYAVDVALINAPPCAGVKTEVMTLPTFRYESLNHDPKTAQISVTGKCNVIQATVARI